MAVKLPFWLLVGLGKAQLKSCIPVGIFGLTAEKTEQRNRQKNQLRNYCVKENFNSERIMWRNRFYNTAEGTGTYSSAAVSENTCTAWPRVVCKSCLVSPVLNWCCCSVPMHWANCRSVQVTSVMSLGDQMNAFSFQGVWWWAAVFNSTCPFWLENTFLYSSWTSGIYRAESF